MKIEKLYSDYDEYYDERLYSTGNEKALENTAQRIANQDTFNRQEEELIKRQTKKLKL
jgi:hypothetical protein